MHALAIIAGLAIIVFFAMIVWDDTKRLYHEWRSEHERYLCEATGKGIGLAQRERFDASNHQ